MQFSITNRSLQLSNTWFVVNRCRWVWKEKPGPCRQINRDVTSDEHKHNWCWIGEEGINARTRRNRGVQIIWHKSRMFECDPTQRQLHSTFLGSQGLALSCIALIIIRILSTIVLWLLSQSYDGYSRGGTIGTYTSFPGPWYLTHLEAQRGVC